MGIEKGLVIVYTGEGKGKTTAALGIVLRAVGYRKKCLIIQFGKVWFSGEIAAVKKLSPFVKIIQGGKGFLNILGSKVSKKEHKAYANETFRILYEETTVGKWDIVVADEIVGAVSSGVLSLRKALKLISDKPEKVDLVLTGHNAPDSLIRRADLVTMMQEVKHPYQRGVLAKKGIDFLALELVNC